jgi:hypothetical protein
MNRLDTSSPLLAARLRNADRRSQRQAAIAAAALAARVAQLDQASVRQALDLLDQHALDQVPRDQLASLVDELDEIAWSIQEAEDEGSSAGAEYLSAFGRARAAAAVLFAADPDPEIAALEAVYEAGSATADDSAVIAVVEEALGPD